MNCQSHLYRGQNRTEITRRWFFQQCGVGLGAIALGTLFQQNGWGAELSELLPYLAEVADDIAIVKSMHTDAFNHAPAQILMTTGSQQFGRPSFGAWTTYGLGSEAQDLPGFVVFSTGGKGTSGGASN